MSDAVRNPAEVPELGEELGALVDVNIVIELDLCLVEVERVHIDLRCRLPCAAPCECFALSSMAAARKTRYF